MKKILLFSIIAIAMIVSSCTQPKPVVSLADIAVQSLLLSAANDSTVNPGMVISKTLAMRRIDQELSSYLKTELPKKIIIMASCCGSCYPDCCVCEEQEARFVYQAPLKKVELLPAGGGDPAPAKTETIGKVSIFSLDGKLKDGSYILKVTGDFEGGELNIPVIAEKGALRLQ